jgi:NADH:ubiquinone oxidoreductase subunit F (NADH-binding)
LIPLQSVRVLLNPEGPVDPTLAAYRFGGGYQAFSKVRKEAASGALLDQVEQSQLAGKGGANFPTHRKMRLMLAQAGDRKILVINGSEHEPGSLKDRYLLEHLPHKVLEGALITAHLVNANEIVVAINEGSRTAVTSFRNAVGELLSAPDIDRSGISLTVQIVPEIYIVGEETALLETLEGKQPLPRTKPPFPIQQGLHGLPTLVQNVETVAHLPFIFSAGAAAYRALGPSGMGVTLCTLGEEFANPGVYEIPLGTSIQDVLYRWGHGLRDGTAIKCIQPGGPSSGFLSSSDFALPLDAETLGRHDSALGCAVIRAYSVGNCMVRRISDIMHFFAGASCGQCPRCRMETNMLDTIVKQVLAGKGTPKLLEKVDGIIKLASGQGMCSLISMPVAPIRTGLHLFHDEFVAHLENRCVCCARIAHEHGGTETEGRAS